MSASRTRLLLVEDDPQIQRFLVAALEAHAYELLIASSASEGLRLAAARQPDILIVDLGLPDLPGDELIRRVREWFTRPIIVLSARERESDKVGALDAGADDYVTKPFGIGELLARLRVAERHLAARANGEVETNIRIGSVVIDLAARRVTRDGVDIHLTPIEYDLLCALARHRGKVMTHRQILERVWGGYAAENSRQLRVYINYLRGKLEADPANPRLIVTEPGVGYRIRVPETRAQS
jgi:two-component system KDP operon response regulator KdpE